MSYRIYIAMCNGKQDIEAMCDDYVIDERGISMHNPDVINPATNTNSDVLHIDKNSYKLIYVNKIA